MVFEFFMDSIFQNKILHSVTAQAFDCVGKEQSWLSCRGIKKIKAVTSGRDIKEKPQPVATALRKGKIAASGSSIKESSGHLTAALRKVNSRGLQAATLW